MTVEAFAPGMYPRSEALVQATRDLDRGRTTEAEVDARVQADQQELIGAQQAAGLDLLTDGMLRWQDHFRPLLQAADGLETGALTRYLDTNTFYRAPKATGAPKLAGPLDERFSAPVPGARVATLPSPYALARGTDVSPKAMAEDVLAPALAGLDAELVVLVEPFLAHDGASPDELREPLEALCERDDARALVPVLGRGRAAREGCGRPARRRARDRLLRDAPGRGPRGPRQAAARRRRRRAQLGSRGSGRDRRVREAARGARGGADRARPERRPPVRLGADRPREARAPRPGEGGRMRGDAGRTVDTFSSTPRDRIARQAALARQDVPGPRAGRERHRARAHVGREGRRRGPRGAGRVAAARRRRPRRGGALVEPLLRPHAGVRRRRRDLGRRADAQRDVRLGDRARERVRAARNRPELRQQVLLEVGGGRPGLAGRAVPQRRVLVPPVGREGAAEDPDHRRLHARGLVATTSTTSRSRAGSERATGASRRSRRGASLRSTSRGT